MKNLNFYSLDASNNQILRMIVNEIGNVGIGTSVASKKLEVTGDISFNGDLYQNGELFTGGSTIDETTDVSLNNLVIHGDLSANDASFNVIDVNTILIDGRDLISGAPEALDTLNELAAALDNSANFATNVTTTLSSIQSQLSTKQDSISTNDLSLGDINGLYLQLDSKQDTITTNDLTIAFTSGLQTALDSKHPLINETTDVSLNNLVIHGDLSANDASFNVIDVNTILIDGRDLISGAPEALDTLNELAAALDNSANFATNVTTTLSSIQSQLSTKQDSISTNDLSLGDINGLYLQLNSKQNTITNDDLTIAFTSGLQTALDSKHPLINETTDVSLNNLVIHGDLSANDASFNVIDASSINTTSTSYMNSIIPSANNLYSLGDASNVWKDVYIGPGSLYIDGQKVLESDADTIVVGADENQNLKVNTHGSGVLQMESASGIQITTTGSGNIELGSTGSGIVRITDNLALNGNIEIYNDSTNEIKINDNLNVTGDYLQNGTNINTIYATLASPSLTGTPIAPTATSGTNTTQIATTAFVSTAVSNLVNGAPGALDTLSELASALDNSGNFATNVTNTLGSLQTQIDAKQPTISSSARLNANLIHDGTISNTEYGYLNGVTSAIQTQLDTKITASSTNTLTNKTLTSPIISSISNTGTLTLPTSTGTIALTSDIPTQITNNNQLINGAGYITLSSSGNLTNKSMEIPNNSYFLFKQNGSSHYDARIYYDTNNKFIIGNLLTNFITINSSNAMTLNTIPTVGGVNLVTTSSTDTLTNKTLTSPIISSISNTGTLTLPTSTGTIALTSDIPTQITNNNQLINGAGYITASSSITHTNLIVGGTTYQSATAPTNGMLVEGNVGIGTNNPGSYKLNVNGNTKLQQTYVSKIVHHQYSGTGIWFDTADTLRFIINNKQRMIFDDNGRLGIGDNMGSTPICMLDISCNLNTTGINVKGAGIESNGKFQFILRAEGPDDSTQRVVHFLNSSTRTDDGGANTYTIRNDYGNLRLGNASYDTIINGNVGIGTTDPKAKLNVEDGGFLVGGIDNVTQQGCHIQWNRSGQHGETHIINNIGEATNNGESSGIKFAMTDSNGTVSDKMFIRNDGNVGIGTTNPQAKLELYDNTVGSSSTLILKRNVTTYTGSDDGAAIEFQTYYPSNTTSYLQSRIRGFDDNLGGQGSGAGGIAFDTYYVPDGNNVYSERMRITSQGNVGIGTTSPGAKLEVKGNALNNGAIYIKSYATTNKTFELKIRDDTTSSYPLHIGPINSFDGININNSNGNVGFGTTNPLSLLTVGSHALTNGTRDLIRLNSYRHNEAFTIRNNDDANTGRLEFFWGNTNNNTAQHDNTIDASILTMIHTGNVGIRTTDPKGADLMVNGYIKVVNGISFRNESNYDGTSINCSIHQRGHSVGDGIQFNGYSGLVFTTNNGVERMRITRVDGIGIGTTTPQYALDVHHDGATGFYSTYWNDTSTISDDGTVFSTGGDSQFSNAAANYGQGRISDINSNFSYKISLHAQYGIYCSGGGFMTSSDRRIKKNIVDVSDNVALEMVKNIPCKYYTHIDERLKGSGKTIGFIAQEVAEVMPIAVKLKKEFIPSEMRILENLSWDTNNHVVTDISDCSGVKYKFFVSNDISNNPAKEVEIIGNADNTFTFDTSYNNIFCYGKEVDDFHALDKNKLFALNFSATQELIRKVESHQHEIESLKMFNTESNNTLNNLIQENQQIKQENQELNQQIQYIMQHLGL